MLCYRAYFCKNDATESVWNFSEQQLSSTLQSCIMLSLSVILDSGGLWSAPQISSGHTSDIPCPPRPFWSWYGDAAKVGTSCFCFHRQRSVSRPRLLVPEKHQHSTGLEPSTHIRSSPAPDCTVTVTSKLTQTGKWHWQTIVRYTLTVISYISTNVKSLELKTIFYQTLKHHRHWANSKITKGCWHITFYWDTGALWRLDIPGGGQWLLLIPAGPSPSGRMLVVSQFPLTQLHVLVFLEYYCNTEQIGCIPEEQCTIHHNQFFHGCATSVCILQQHLKFSRAINIHIEENIFRGEK